MLNVMKSSVTDALDQAKLFKLTWKHKRAKPSCGRSTSSDAKASLELCPFFILASSSLNDPTLILQGCEWQRLGEVGSGIKEGQEGR